MSKNRILTIQNSSFNKLTLLNHLNMSYNDLDELNEKTFLGLDKLATLDLRSKCNIHNEKISNITVNRMQKKTSDNLWVEDLDVSL